jgi:hypothetical protein
MGVVAEGTTAKDGAAVLLAKAPAGVDPVDINTDYDDLQLELRAEPQDGSVLASQLPLRSDVVAPQNDSRTLNLAVDVAIARKGVSHRGT